MAPGLILQSGLYRWQFADAVNPNGGWDNISVAGTVTVNVTAAPFTLKILPVNLSLLGTVANFDPTFDQSWPVLTATAINGFSANSFAVDYSALSGSIGIGQFFVTVNGANTLMLNFTPVPEPSTYALLGTGLAIVMFTMRRRRSAK